MANVTDRAVRIIDRHHSQHNANFNPTRQTMGNNCGSSEVSGLSLDKVSACGAYYFDNEMDFGLNEADAKKLLKEGAGLDDDAAAAIYGKFSDAANPDALFSCLDFLGAAAATCQGSDDDKKSALFKLFDFSKEGKPVYQYRNHGGRHSFQCAPRSRARTRRCASCARCARTRPS